GEPLSRRAVRYSEHFTRHIEGMAGRNDAAHALHTYRSHPGTGAVAGLAGPWSQHAAADPECAPTIDDRWSGPDGRMQENQSVSVESTGRVLLQPHSHPQSIESVPGLPGQWRIVGIDAITLDLRRQREPQNMPAEIVLESEI